MRMSGFVYMLYCRGLFECLLIKLISFITDFEVRFVDLNFLVEILRRRDPKVSSAKPFSPPFCPPTNPAHKSCTQIPHTNLAHQSHTPISHTNSAHTNLTHTNPAHRYSSLSSSFSSSSSRCS